MIEEDFKINITNLKVKTIIGIHEEEKKNPQILIIDVKILPPALALCFYGIHFLSEIN